jgi:hypothetical protein
MNEDDVVFSFIYIISLSAILLLLFGVAMVALCADRHIVVVVWRCYGSAMRGRHAHTLLHFSSRYARLAGRLP